MSDGSIETTRPEEFDDPLRTIAMHVGNALVNALSEGARDDGLILAELEVAAERCASLMDDSEAFLPVYVAYAFLGGDVSGLRGMRERDQTAARSVLDAVIARADDMPI